MALFWQTVVFLLLAAALGFVIGWVTRGARASGERAAAAAPPQEGMDAALVEECDRLRAELAAAHDSERQLEDSLVQLRGLADARASRVHELERAETSSRERIARLEQELSEARVAGDRQPGSAPTAAAAAEPPEPVGAAPPVAEPVPGAPPTALSAPEGEPDDLKQISGIGPSIERTLHELGINMTGFENTEE